jgi:hypothetical protein
MSGVCRDATEIGRSPSLMGQGSLLWGPFSGTTSFFAGIFVGSIPARAGEPARSIDRAHKIGVVALPLNRLCLNLCGGTVAFSPAAILDRPGHTWRV